MADSLLEYVEENQGKLITPEDKLLKKVEKKTGTPGTVMSGDPVAGALSREKEELAMMQAPQGLGTDLANVVRRIPGQVVETGRRALGGAADLAAEVARGQERLFEIDDPSGAGAAFWDRTAEMVEEQATLQGFAADKAEMVREEELPLRTETGQLMGEVGHSIAAMTPALAAGIVTGTPQAALFVMGNQTGLETFQRAKTEGMSTEVALKQAVATGAAEGIFEALPTSMLFSWFKKGKKGFAKHLKDYLKYVGAEVATEIPTTWTQNAAEIYYSQVESNPEKASQDVKDYFSFKPVQVGEAVYQFTDDATHTALVTALQSTILGGLGKGASITTRKAGEHLQERRTERAREEGLDENYNMATRMAADIMAMRQNDKAESAEATAVAEAEETSQTVAQEVQEDITEGHQPFSLDDESPALGETAREEQDAERIDQAFSQAEETVDDIRDDQAALEQEIEDEAELDRHESPAAEDLKVDHAIFKQAARAAYAKAKTYVEFMTDLVGQFGEKVKKYAIRLWNAYKASPLSSEVGAVGDIENVPQKKTFKLPIDKLGKDQGKADLANAFIGFGDEGRYSSTEKYWEAAQEQGIPTNEEIQPDENTVAFVSVSSEGNDNDLTIEQSSRILDVGGSIVMDKQGTGRGESHSRWNKKGEGAVQDALTEKYGPPTKTEKGYSLWKGTPTKVEPQEKPVARRPVAVEPEFQGYQEELPPEAYEEVPPQYEEEEPQIAFETVREVNVAQVKGLKAKDGKSPIHIALRDGQIVWDQAEAVKAFAQKRWTKPRLLFDHTAAVSLPEKFFRNFKEFKEYSVEHEKAHMANPYEGEEQETLGQYEDRMNRIALKAIGRALPTPPKKAAAKKEKAPVIEEPPRVQAEMFPKKPATEEEAEEAAVIESELDAAINKARTDEDVEALFAAELNKNLNEYMEPGAFGSPEARHFSAFEAYLKEHSETDEDLIKKPTRAGRKEADLRSPEQRAIDEQERRLENVRDRETARKNAKMSDKQYSNHQGKILRQVFEKLSKVPFLLQTDPGVLPLTASQLVAKDKNGEFVNAPRNIRDQIVQELMKAAKSFYIGDILEEIYREEKTRSVKLLKGVPDVVFEIQSLAEKRAEKEEDTVARGDVAEISPETEAALQEIFAKFKQKISAEDMRNVLFSQVTTEVFEEITGAQFKANERAMIALAKTPHKVLAFLEERLLDKMKTEDIPRAAMNKLIADFGIEFGIESAKGQKITPITITPPVMKTFIEWARKQRKAYQKEDLEIVARLKEGLAIKPEGELTQKELAAKQAKEEQDVPAAIEKARKSGKGEERVSDTIAREASIKAREEKSNIPRRKLTVAEKVALKGNTTIDSEILDAPTKTLPGEGTTPITVQQKREHRRMLRNNFYSEALKLFKEGLDENTRRRNRAIIGLFPTFYNALHKQATQGRTGKANFLNLDDITLKMKDTAEVFVKSLEYKEMTPEQKKNHPLGIFYSVSIKERDAIVEKMMKFTTPTTGTWEAALWNDKLEGEISFTAENVLELANIKTAESAAEIGKEGGPRVTIYKSDPSVTRSQTTPTINTKGYTLTDVKLNSGAIIKALTPTEVKALEDGTYEVVQERNSNQGNLVGIRVYTIPKEAGLPFTFKDIEMTEAEFDRMERKHDPEKHEPYITLEKNLGTVKNYGKGVVINGWDFVNNMETLLDAASELIPEASYNIASEALAELAAIEEALVALEATGKVSKDLQKRLTLPEGETEYSKENLKSTKWQIKANDGALAHTMVLVKASLANKQFKESSIRNPAFFDWYVNQYPQLGYNAADFMRIYMESGANRSVYETRISRAVKQKEDAQADAIRQLYDIAGKLSEKTPTKEELQELEKEGEAQRTPTGFTVTKEGRRHLLRSYILQRLPQRLRAPYLSISDKAVDINSLPSAKDRAIVDAFLQVEALIETGKGNKVANTLNDRGIIPKTQDVASEKIGLDEFEESLRVDAVVEILDPAAQTFYQQISESFGIEIVVVSDPTYKSRYVPKGKNGKPTAIINIENHSSFHHIIGHELFHHIWNSASDPQIAIFKKAIAAVSEMNFKEALRVAKETDPINGEEELYAEIFAQVFRREGFYEELAQTFEGQTIAQKIISRLVNLIRKVQGLFTKPGHLMYEGKILFRNADMNSVFELFADLVGGPMYQDKEVAGRTYRYEGILDEKGNLRHDEIRFFTAAGVASAKEIKGYLNNPAQWLKKKVWQKIFKPGTKGWKDLLTNIEDTLSDVMDWIAKVKGNFWWVHWRAKPEAVNLASMPVHGATKAEQEAYFRVVKKFERFFQDPVWTESALRKLHDDFVRGVKVIETTGEDGKITKETIQTGGINVGTKDNPNVAGVKKAKALGYSDAVVWIFQEYKAVSDEIHSQLEEIFPGFKKRETHYGQTLIWTRANGAAFHDSFDSVLEEEFSPLEGSKRYMKGKNTQMATEDIAEHYDLKYRTINPNIVFLDYVREANKLIQLHKMMNEGQKLGLVEIFKNDRDMARAGFEGIEDPAFVLSKMNLGHGFKVKINKDTYAHEDGQELLFSTKEKAQEFIDNTVRPRDNASIFAADIEEVKTEKRADPYKYSVVVDNGRGKFLEVNSFDNEKAAKEWTKGKDGYDPDMEGVTWKVKPVYSEGGKVQIAKYGFHPDLAKLLNNSLAKDWLREGSFMGISGETAMAAKNNLTAIEFAVSMFHFATITQEAIATQTSWAARRYGKRGIFKGLIETHSDVQDIFMVMTKIVEQPELAENPAIREHVEKLFGTTNVDVLDVVNQFFMAGGMTHMDPSIRPTTYRQGTMRYYKDTPSLEVESDRLRFVNVHRGVNVFTKVSLVEMMDSVKEVYQREIANEPNKQIRATFQSFRFGFLQGATSWLMETGIPKVKMAMWAREYTLQLDRQAELIQTGQKTKEEIARDAMLFIEDKFGEVNWKNNWMKPSMATALKFLFRSFTWFTGSWKALSKAGIDISKWGWFNVAKGQFGSEQHYKLTDKGTWGITAIITHMMTVQMINLAYQLVLATGDDDEVPDDPDTPLLTQLLFPRYDPSDPAARVTVPSYVTEGYKIMRHLGAVGDEPEATKLISGRFNVLLRNGFETFWTGTDWRGTQVRNPNDNLAEQAFDSFLHMINVAPIAASSAYGIMRQKGFMPEVALLGLAGLTDAPAAAKRSDAVNYGFHLSRGAHTTESTEEEADQRAEIQRALSQAGRGNKEPLNKLRRDKIISVRQYSRLIKKVPRFGGRPNPAYVPEINRVISILTIPDTLKVIDRMSVREKRLTKRAIETKFRNMVKRRYHGQQYVDAQRKELRKRGYSV